MNERPNDAAPDYLNDDENIKMMRETAHTYGLTALLLAVRRAHLKVQLDLELERARITRALELLGVSDDGGQS